VCHHSQNAYANTVQLCSRVIKKRKKKKKKKIITNRSKGKDLPSDNSTCCWWLPVRESGPDSSCRQCNYPTLRIVLLLLVIPQGKKAKKQNNKDTINRYMDENAQSRVTQVFHSSRTFIVTGTQNSQLRVSIRIGRNFHFYMVHDDDDVQLSRSILYYFSYIL
jgi:hypothetical protein